MPRQLQGSWDTVESATAVVRPQTTSQPNTSRHKRGEMAAAACMWDYDQGNITPAVRQMLTYPEIRRHGAEESAHMTWPVTSGGVSRKLERPSTVAWGRLRVSLKLTALSVQGPSAVAEERLQC
jgi:DNA-binding transcriptional regulator YdaS (Cro superfamily)